MSLLTMVRLSLNFGVDYRASYSLFFLWYRDTND